MRKDFTPSERVAIAEAVSREIGNRRGNPTLKPIPPKSAGLQGKETRDIAAEHVGFGHTTYHAAKRGR